MVRFSRTASLPIKNFFPICVSSPKSPFLTHRSTKPLETTKMTDLTIHKALRLRGLTLIEALLFLGLAGSRLHYCDFLFLQWQQPK